MVIIISLVGSNLIANGDDSVIIDGESIWLEIPEHLLSIDKFLKRQRTNPRQYYTWKGVTIHKQLQPEQGR